LHEEILEILVALDEGGGTVDEVAATTGRNPAETQDMLERLSKTGFITWQEPTREELGGFHLSQSGRTLLRLGYEEAFKRNLNARLGGDEDSAS
jgi:DNA-binding IclR family transcriptional regulator